MAKEHVVQLFGSKLPMKPEWPEPEMELIADDRGAPPALPDEALPDQWMDWSRKTAQALGCPVDYVAGGLLAGASTWLGNVRRVCASPDWIEAPHLWAALVGDPSFGKTPALRPVIQTAKELELEAEPRWRDEQARYERDSEAAKAATEAWHKDIKEAVAQRKAAPDRPDRAAPPEPPRRPRVIAMDATTEELMAMLSANPRGLLLVRDELAGWLGSFDRYNNGAGADRGFYLETWNGGSFTSDRVKYSGKPVEIKYCSLSIVGGIVPDRLREALAGGDDGLAARFLWIWPDAPPYQPLARATDAQSEERRKKLIEGVHRLQRLTFQRDDVLGAVPRIIPLADDALVLFEEIRSDVATVVRSSRRLMASWYGKTPARALRLALVIEHLAWAGRRSGPEPTAVTGKSMRSARAYLDYAALMLHRVISGLCIGEAEQDAADIARALHQQHATELNERTLYRTRGYAHLRDLGRRSAALAVLERGGWIRRPAGAPANGRPPKDWEVNPQIASAE